MMKFHTVMVAALAALVATAAQADPRLDEKIYDPYVRNHVLEVGTRFARENGGELDRSASYIGELEYGVSDNLSLAVLGKVTRGEGQGSRLRGVGVEAVYYLGQIPGLGVDVGLYGEYMKGLSDGETALEGKLLFAKQAGPVQAVLNLIVERPLHVPGEGYANYGYAGSVTWRAAKGVRVGVQAFGDLGDDHNFLKGRQGAYIGPELRWETRARNSPVELEVGVSWLKSVGANTREADNQVRVTLELERRF
jgi:hypothetical protein